MKQSIYASLLVFVAMLFSLVGCTSVPTATTRSPRIATTLKITGTEGAPFTGYYLVEGRKVPISGSIPKTITDFGISGCEFRKRNSQDVLWLGAHDGSSTLNLVCQRGTAGVSADFSGGWRARTIKKGRLTSALQRTAAPLGSGAVQVICQ